MAVKRYPSRWAIMATSLLFMSIGGCVYSFGLISDTQKSRLNLTQSQVDIIAVFGQIGGSATIIPGIFNNRYGPSVTIWVGLIVISLGWWSVTILTTQIIDISSLSYSYVIVSVAAFIFGNGLTWLSGIAAPTIAQNFPKCDHGKYLGLAKGYLGIGSAYIATYKSDLANDHVDFFMYSLCVFFPLFITIHACFLVQLPKYYIYQYNEKEKVTANTGKIWYFFAFVLMFYLMVQMIVSDVIDLDNKTAIQITLFAITQILWYSPFFTAAFAHGPFWIHLDEENDDKLGDLLINPGTDKPKEAKISNVQDVGMPFIFKTYEFWLIYVPFVFVAGSGLIFIANVAQIVESALSTKNDDRESDSITTSLVTIISCGNFMGRVVAGYLSDLYRNKYHRVFFTLQSSFGMFLSMIYMVVISYMFTGDDIIIPLIIGAFFIGISYGWMFSVVLAAVCDLWGTKYLSGNYAIFDSCGALGQIILSNGVFAVLYEYQGKRKENDGNKCYGNKCFQYSFAIASICCILAFCMSFKLWKMKRKERLKQKGYNTIE